MKSPSEVTCPSCGEMISTDYLSNDPTRRRYFAIISECFDSLPDDLAERFKSKEHLRKWCLVKAGWCEMQTIAVGKTVRQVAEMMRKLDPHAVIAVNGEVITVFTAKSQSRKNQPKPQFMETAEKVYDILSKMLGTDVEQAA